MTESAPVEQPDPPPPVPPVPGVPGRNRAVIGGSVVGLIALAVVLLTLPPGDLPSTAPAARDSAQGTPPTPAPAPPPSATPSPSSTSGLAGIGASAPPAAAPPPAPSPATPLPAGAAPTATIVATGIPRAAIARLDGKRLVRRRTIVSSGQHVLAVARPGYQPGVDTVQLKAGEIFTWSPHLVALPSAKTVAVPATSPRAPLPAAGAPRRGSADDVACRQDMASASWLSAYGTCTKAARGGSAIAARSVALLFQRGNGVQRSDDSAARWYGDAARRGDAESMYQLASFLERGRGMKKDLAAALDWYTRAGNAGHAGAQFALGQAYERGRLDIAKNRTKALDWYRKAAAQGHREAATKVRDLSR